MLRYLGRINKELNRFTVTAMSLAVLAVICFVAYLCYKANDDGLSIVTEEKIDDTPNVILQMKEIGQWEFLAINDEELVDTVRNGFFSKDELIRIYYGSLRLGIDFSKCSDDWIKVNGDTTFVTLPKVYLLDDNFIDEAKTKSFFEQGRWSNADRKALYEKARRQMLKHCLTDENLTTAQQNAEQQVKQFLKPMVKGEIKIIQL